MKRMVLVMAAAVLIAAAGVATAADTATVDNSATVRGTCRFNAAGTAIPLGDLPFDGAGNATGTSAGSTINFWCTNGASYAITDDFGLNEVGVQRRLASTVIAPTEYINYSLTYLPATGTGNGPLAPIALNLTATVGATYTGNTPASYGDTVTLTVNP